MEYEIAPEPTEEEREAILAALEEEARDEPERGPWREEEA
jgi:hypothetical protein